MAQKVWFITGCTSGIGEALAKAVLVRGDLLIATARAPIDRLTGLKEAGATTLELDANASPHNVTDVVNQAIKVHGRIDYLVPASGYIHTGIIEVITPEAWEKQLAVNFYGVTNLVSAVLPHIRAAKSGCIAFTNSVYSHAGMPSSSPYVTTKHAIHGYAKTLTQEIKHFNIKIVSLDIGFIDTPVLGGIQNEPCEIEDYAPLLEMQQQYTVSMLNNHPGDVTRCAEAIITAVTTTKTNFAIVPIGSDAVATIREYAKYLTQSCDQWEALAKSVDRDGPRQGFFEHVPHYIVFD